MWRYCRLVHRRCGSNNRSNNRRSMEQTPTLDSPGFCWRPTDQVTPTPVNLANPCLWDPKIVSLGALQVPCKACMCVQGDMRYLRLLYPACGLVLRTFVQWWMWGRPLWLQSERNGDSYKRDKRVVTGLPFLAIYDELRMQPSEYVVYRAIIPFHKAGATRACVMWALIFFLYIPCRCNLEIGCFYDTRVLIENEGYLATLKACLKVEWPIT